MQLFYSGNCLCNMLGFIFDGEIVIEAIYLGYIQLMPEHKGGKYQRRSSSSDSNHRRSRDRRGDKELPQLFERRYRRSHSRSKERHDQKSKYEFQFVHKDEKKHYDYRRQSYSNNYQRKREGDRREKEEFVPKTKYSRPEEKDPRSRLQESRLKQKESRYDKRESKRNNSSSRERKRKFSSSSSHSSKQQSKNDIKFTYNKRSPEKLREKQANKRSKHSSDSQPSPRKEIRNQQKPRFFPPPPSANTTRRFESTRPPFVDHFHRPQPERIAQPQRWEEQKNVNYPIKQERSINSYQRGSFSARPPFIPAPPKINFRPIEEYHPREYNLRRQAIGLQTDQRQREEETLSPLKRQLSESRQIRQEEIPRAKVSKVQMLVNEARQNLTVSPPATSFLMLETLKTMNKFHIETLDQKWVSQLKGELENKYAELKEGVLGKLSELPEETQNNCGLYIWQKEVIREREQELRSEVEELRQLSCSLGQLVRRMKLVE